MSEHTPGPWEVKGSISTRDGIWVDMPEGRRAFAYASNVDLDPDSEETAYANAHLIAAAPDLLEALENIGNDDGRIPKTIWDMCVSAIKKAKGEE